MKAYKQDASAGDTARARSSVTLVPVRGLIPTLKPEQTESLRNSVLANYAAVKRAAREKAE